MRWQDFIAVLPLPLLIVVLYVLLWWNTIGHEKEIKTKHFKVLLITLAAGIYFFAASSGLHEVTNYLNHRYCITSVLEPELCGIIGYNDDVFSHELYYLGLVLMNVALLVSEYVRPRTQSMTKGDMVVVSANALFIAAGIVANLAFEAIGIDVNVFALLAGLSLFLLYLRKFKYQHVPVIYYSALAYTLGVVTTLVIQQL